MPDCCRGPTARRCVGLGAAKSQHRMRRPGRCRRQFQRLAIMTAAMVVGALRFDERPRRPSSRVSSRSAMAEALARLRGRCRAVRISRAATAPADHAWHGGARHRHGGGRRGIAVADRQQFVGDGVTAAGVTAFTPCARDPLRRAPDPAQDRPRQHAATTVTPSARIPAAGFDPPAARRQHHVAGLIGNDAGPAAASAINTRNRMIRYIRFHAPVWRARHGPGGKTSGCGERSIPHIAFVDSLRRRAIGAPAYSTRAGRRPIRCAAPPR